MTYRVLSAAIAFTLTATGAELVLQPRPGALSAAIEAAAPGTVIRLRPGLYRESITIAKPLTITADPGATLDPSEAFPVTWKPAPQYGPGVYQAAVTRQPTALFRDGQTLAQVDAQRPEARRAGPWHWRTLLTRGTPRTGFTKIRGLWLYQPGTVLLHLADDADPNRHTWTAVYNLQPALTIRAAADVRVSGLTIAHSSRGVLITDHAQRAQLTHCRIGPWDRYGVEVLGGATHTLVEKNEIFRGAIESMDAETEFTPSGDFVVSPTWYEIWRLHKITGFYDRVGISLTLSGRANRLLDNHVHDTFDGINLGEGEKETLDIPLPDTTHDQDAEIAGNLIERSGDSGIEVGGPAVNVRIHHNTIRRTVGSLRFKLPRVGPVFIYNNRIEEAATYNIWYSMDDSPAEGYIYHNTVIGGRSALMYHRLDKQRNIGAPRWHFINNLFLTRLGAFIDQGHSMPINFTWDCNVIAGDRRPYPNPLRNRYNATADDAKGAACDLSHYFQGQPLPGYIPGKSPNAGTF